MRDVQALATTTTLRRLASGSQRGKRSPSLSALAGVAQPGERKHVLRIVASFPARQASTCAVISCGALSRLSSITITWHFESIASTSLSPQKSVATYFPITRRSGVSIPISCSNQPSSRASHSSIDSFSSWGALSTICQTRIDRGIPKIMWVSREMIAGDLLLTLQSGGAPLRRPVSRTWCASG
jgi:hypothetical protein